MFGQLSLSIQCRTTDECHIENHLSSFILHKSNISLLKITGYEKSTSSIRWL